MKIIYAENPLSTVVELDERDLLLLKAKAELSHHEDIFCYFHIYSDPDSKNYNPEAAKKIISYDSIYSEESTKEIERTVDYWSKDLKGVHSGDCTCVPCSCSKCQAEEALGIDTIPGLGKQLANYINIAFKTTETGVITCEDAIDYFDAYIALPKGSWEDQYAATWHKQRQAAKAWLINYKTEKLGR